MKFTLLIYENKGVFDGPEGQKALTRIVAKHRELGEALTAAKVPYVGAALTPSAQGMTVKTGPGERKTRHDGPFAETREHLAGYYEVDVKDLEEALHWAERIPMMPGGTVEVRAQLIHD